MSIRWKPAVAAWIALAGTTALWSPGAAWADDRAGHYLDIDGRANLYNLASGHAQVTGAIQVGQPDEDGQDEASARGSVKVELGAKGGGEDLETAQSAAGSLQKAAKGAIQSDHQAAVQSLKQAIAALHQSQQAERAAHQKLIAAARQFLQALREAAKSGDTQAVDTATQRLTSILQTLRQALGAQASGDAEAKTSNQAQARGDLEQAIAAITAVNQRMQAKTQAMLTAAEQLTALTKQIQASGQSTSGGNVTITAAPPASSGS
ncbi:hypothetical protein [Alicyclobacillus sp.]|uniref:hypothetical protein n=1 Tax=Alicyclobacillus sp. TaxID=61169 RepID=UPI0025BD563E|nr:hypothetical protein [Alicyclobacillus sp.]MCL6517065.1 hypothetical protein [Alicyclobacillus sp.]